MQQVTPVSNAMLQRHAHAHTIEALPHVYVPGPVWMRILSPSVVSLAVETDDRPASDKQSLGGDGVGGGGGSFGGDGGVCWQPKDA